MANLFEELDAKATQQPQSVQDQQNYVEGPDGEAMQLPPNTGAENLYGGPGAPKQKRNIFMELDAKASGQQHPIEGQGDGPEPSPTPRKMIGVNSINSYNLANQLPQVSDSVADSMGLKAWKDNFTGMEIRRAQPATKEIPEQGAVNPSWVGRNPFETGLREFATSAATSTDNAIAGSLRASAGQIQSNTSRAKDNLANLESELSKAQAEGDQEKILAISSNVDLAREGVANLEKADQDAATGSGPLDRIRRTVRGWDQGAKEALQKGAEFFTDKAKSDREFYDTKPDDTSAAAQVGRGLGNVAAMTPTMVIPGGAGLAITALQGASSSYNEAYEATRETLQKAGVTDEKTIDDAASQAGSTAATKTFPALAAYMVGGKITAAGVSALLKGASPIVKGIVGGTSAAGANVVTSSGIRAVEGQDWRPTIEGTAQDVAFGAIHGAGEYNQAKVTPDQGAPRFTENPGQTRTFPADNSQNRQDSVENTPKPAENTPQRATDGNDWTTATDPGEGEEQAPIAPVAPEVQDDSRFAPKAEGQPVPEPEQPSQQASRLHPEKYGISYMDPKTLKLSEDVPNFKEGADPETGVVEGQQLQGELDLKGMGPILVWERTNGDKEVISGRHRLDLAKRTDAPLVPVQILKESEGFSKQDAMTLDAEQNIKDEKGTTKDYANYFRNSEITREEAEAGGLLSRAKGRSGFSIGKSASDDLYASFSAGRISEAKAAAIAEAAPGNPGLQRAGQDAAGRMSAEELPGFLKLLERSKGPQEVQAGLFGEDDSAIQDSIRISKAAAKKAEELQEQILAVKGAAKRPEAAAKLGVDVKDPQGLQKKILDLSMQRDRYRNFWQHADILEELSGKSLKTEEPTKEPIKEDTATGSLFGEDSTPTIQKNGEGNLFGEAEMPFNLSGETDRSSLTPEEQKAKALDEAMAAENDKNQGSLFDEKPEPQQIQEAKESGEISEEYDSLDKSIQERYRETPLGLPEYREIARAFMSGELAPESGVHVTLKDGTEFDGVMKDSQGMPWISENGSVRLTLYSLEDLGNIESIKVTRSASDAISEKLERKYGEIAYTQPETKEDYERVLKDIATQIRKAREESDGGSNVIRYLQLEAQFDKVADEIQLAKNKRAYIKKYPGSYADGIPFPQRPWKFNDAADQNYAIPKPSDFDPDPEIRKKKTAPNPSNSETLAQLKDSIYRAESDIYSKKLSGERKARLERIIEKRKEQIEKGDYYEKRLEAWNAEHGIKTEDSNAEKPENSSESSVQESEKPFPTTREEVQAQLETLSEKRKKDSEGINQDELKTDNQERVDDLPEQAVAQLAIESGQRPLTATKESIVANTDPKTLSKALDKIKAPKAGIQDFGEKIGGARKDTATKGGRGASRIQDDRPGWARRYEIREEMKQSERVHLSGRTDVEIDPFEKARFRIVDLRNLDWMKQPKQVGRETFATREEAEKAIPLIAVARNHSVRMTLKDGVEKPRFSTREESEKWHDKHKDDYVFQIWRKVTDRKMVQVVKQDFPTRESAMEYMAKHAKDIIEAKTAWREELIVKPENAVRTGSERRKGPATPEMFQDTFGFRGVEFGNWMRQDTGSKERQEVLNNAYDGLRDLAEILGVPDKAMSLNGDLALAFGARGQGLVGAKAHYEPEYGVINLTKMSGAGSLAHEWFHAFDHYLARMAGKAPSERVSKGGNLVYPERGFVSEGFGRNPKVRPEVQEAFENLMKTIRNKAVQFVEDSKKAEEFVESTKKRLAEKLVELRRNLESTLQYGSKKAPATAKQLARFDELANRLLEGTDVKTEFRYNNQEKRRAGKFSLSGRWSNDTMDALSDLWKEVRGRSGFKSDKSGVIDSLYSSVRNYADRIEILKSASAEDVKTKTVPTSFRMEATKIDQGSATDYWSTELELAARAFSSYVEDKIANGGAKSEFLSYGSDNELPGYKMWGLKPFPEGAERVAINEAMDKLFRTLKTRETEKGIMLENAGDKWQGPSPHDDNASRSFIDGLNLREVKDSEFGGSDRDAVETARNYLQRAYGISKNEVHGLSGGLLPERGGGSANALFANLQGALQSAFGRRIIFFSAPEGAPKALFPKPHPDVILINGKARDPLLYLTGHEFTHGLKEENIDRYNELMSFVLSKARDRTEYNKMLAERGYKEHQFDDEFLGDFVGSQFGEKSFWESVAIASKKLFRDLAESAISYINRVFGRTGKIDRDVRGYFSNIEEVRNKLISILDQTAKDQASNKGEESPTSFLKWDDVNEVAGSKPQARLLSAMAKHQVAPPVSMREKVASSMRRIKSVVKGLPEYGDFKKEVLKWSARSQRSANEILRVQGQIEEAIPSKEKRDGITNWIQAGGDKSLLQAWADATKNKTLKAGYEAALKLTPEEVATAKKIKDTYDILHARAKRFGIDMGYLQNYVTELWKQDPQRPAGSSPKRLSEFFQFSQERVFPNYFEGEQAGYEPQTKDISKLLGLYMNEMNNAINSRRFVQELSKGKASDGRPLLSPRGSGGDNHAEHGNNEVHLVYPDSAKEGTEDYKKLDQPALHGWSFAGKDSEGKTILVRGDLAVHPDIVRLFKNSLGSSKIRQWWNEKTENPFLNVTKGAAKFILDDLQGAVKGTMLSFSPFHQVQEGIHALGHRINPFGNIPKIDLRDPKQMDAVEHGLMLSHDRLSQSLFMEGVGSNNRNLVTAAMRGIGKPGRIAADRIDAYQDWLFGQYIPGLKLKTYEHILDRNMARFSKDLANGKASVDQVKLLSARQANAAYGHLNYTDMGHNPTIRHAFQVVLLAPDFLEARARFTGQALKGLVGGKVGSEQIQALAFLAITQYITARILNKLQNDDYEWGHPFEVKVGNKLYGLRSVPEDIYKLFGNTAGFIGGRISPIFGRLIQEGFFGVNYRGEHTTWGDALKDIVAGIVPMPFQSLTKNLTPGGRATTISPMEQILSATGLQVHRYSPISETYQIAKKWTDANAPDDARARGRYPVSKYQGLRYALEDGDFQAAKAEVRKLQASGQKLQDIREGFKTSVDHPFTGTKLNDIKFERSLYGHDKEIFKAAVERRRVIIQRFNQSLR
jgi:hypothetical protein